MKKITLAFITFALSCCYVVQAYGNIQLSIKDHKIKEKKEENRTISKEENDSVIFVELGNDYFSYTSENTQYIYDFKNKRVFTVDLLNKKYSDDSLFSNIGFRAFEFQNRLMLGGVLAAGGIEDNPKSPVFSEHLFSLQQKDKKSELSQTSKDNFLVFSAAGKELLSYSPQGVEVSSKEKAMFIKFFRYVFGGHPLILKQLSSDNIIPKSIQVHRYNVFNEHNNLALSEIKTTSFRSFSLDGYSPAVLAADTDPFSNFLNNIKYSKNINLEEHLETLLSQANSYYQNGNYVDAMLCYLEYNLASSRPLPPAYEEQREALNKDENVKKLLATLRLNPKNKEEGEDFFHKLQELEKEAKQQSHVLKIFQANAQSGIGNYQKAKELFYEALKASPHIAGAYKDLGGLYFNDYNAVLAWRCWDVARKISPTNRMLIPINEFESRLLKDYPEFF
jgi:tetratricopeptide (TPR) repeat protein